MRRHHRGSSSPGRHLAAAITAFAVVLAFGAGSAGADVLTWTGDGGGDGIAVGPDGSVYVAEGNLNQVRVLTADGQSIRTIDAGSTSCACNVVDALVNGSDLYLGLTMTGVQQYSTDGAAGSFHFSTGGPVKSLAQTSGGDFIVTSSDSAIDKVERYASNGTFQATLAGSRGTDPDQVNGAWGVAVDSSNHVWVAEYGNSRIHEFGANDLSIQVRNGIPAMAIDVASNGDLYVAESIPFADAIVRYDSQFHELGRWPIESNKDLALTPDEHYLWVSSEHKVTRIDLRSPIPALSASRTQPQTGQNVSFDASGTKVPFSNVSKFEWDLDGDGVFETDTGATPSVSHAYGVPGHVNVQMRATAAESGVTAAASVPLDVQPSSATASAGPNPALTGQPVTVDATASILPDADANTYAWDLDGNGSFETDTGTTPTATTRLTTPGQVTLHVRVTRPGGRVDSADVPVDVRPAPPEGPVGVSINDGDLFTNDAHVTLRVVWPVLTTTVLVSNDGGFRPATSLAARELIDWKLESSGPERLPKQVYLRFDGNGPNYGDDIILDETRPAVTSVTLSRRTLKLRAKDNLSGLQRVQFAGSKKYPRRAQAFRRSFRLMGKPPNFVRVRDRAGNYSRWRAIRTRLL